MTIKRIRAGNIYRPVDEDDSDIVLYAGELAIDSVTGVMKIGDGTTAWDTLEALPGGGGEVGAIDGGDP